MNIALLAHDKKKELMIQFCIAYCGIMAGHDICATSTTGRLVAEATGLPVTRYLSCSQGGNQQIAVRIAYNEIDLVLFFCNPQGTEAENKEVNEIERLCDQYNIPFASNVATAEVLIQGLQRGDMDWRNIVNPKANKDTK
ncbi:MAG: methylglyoxal synthase [Oscillospiraceae bacterium]|nr:methylglyoxal synthase [Oscillospiraceae bacterium]